MTIRQQNLALAASLSPQPLWRYFAEIASIPRPSGREEQILSMILREAHRLNLPIRRDPVGNLLVVKPAPKASRKPLAFQGHVDMVCEQNRGGSHRFELDPIQLTVRSDHPGWIHARGTTLGADNGIGIASMLALMSTRSDASRDLEFLFTVDEETGLTGAQGLGTDLLKADTLLNLDTEEEGALYVGCAGGMDFDGRWIIERSQVAPGNGSAFNLLVKGLKGGHSGIDIDKQRGNAIKILAHTLWQIKGALKEKQFYVYQFSGGSARNAIPREAHATIWVSNEAIENVRVLLEQNQKFWQNLLGSFDPACNLSLEASKDPEVSPFKPSDLERWLRFLLSFPSQPYRFELDIPGLVRTSANLGVLQTTTTELYVRSKLRSSLDPELLILVEELNALVALAGGEVVKGGAYCGWQPNLNSDLLQICQETHKKIFGKEAHIKAIHAGLECGLIGNKYPNMSMISFGPNISNAHSPDEGVEIASVERFWTYLNAVVDRLSV